MIDKDSDLDLESESGAVAMDHCQDFSEIEKISQADVDAFIPLEKPVPARVGKPLTADLAGLAQEIARMDLTTPEALRVTPAYQALRFCGIVFSRSWRLSQQSYVSEKIDCFWSHSWKGSRMGKYFTLSTLYNGPAAVKSGCVVAIVMAILFSLELLPGFQRRPHRDVVSSTWALGMGVFIAALVFLLWRPRQEIFLDRMCIVEDNDRLKSEQIFSLAGMLKRSEEMLILWDSTWCDRLWCIFELSAFLKSEGNRQRKLYMRPTSIGPCSVIMFLGCSFAFGPTIIVRDDNQLFVVGTLLFFASLAAFWWAVALRGYFRSVETLQEKLSSVRLDKLKCSCCDMAHQDGEGSPMLCDREVVKKCMDIWFGSQESFELYVRSEVLERVNSELQNGVFSKTWIVLCTSPVFFSFLDVAAYNFRLSYPLLGVDWVLNGLVMCFISLPIFAEWFLHLAYVLRRKLDGPRDVLMNLLVLLLALPLLVIQGSIYLLVRSVGLEMRDVPVLVPALWTLLLTALAAALQALKRLCS